MMSDEEHAGTGVHLHKSETNVTRIGGDNLKRRVENEEGVGNKTRGKGKGGEG